MERIPIAAVAEFDRWVMLRPVINPATCRARLGAAGQVLRQQLRCVVPRIRRSWSSSQ